MSRITETRLDGYKGFTRDYPLSPATLINGRNESGKSACLEALRYALTGDVPAGRAHDRVALYFPARGGSVEVHDAEGRWIRRGIVRDHEMAKVSEVLETSDTPQGAKGPILTAWKASEVVVDIGKLYALSPNARREFVLQLCGGGGSTEDLVREVADEYARRVGGPAVLMEYLKARAKDFAPKEQAFIEAWDRRRGIEEVLTASVPKEATLSQACLKLGEVAKDSKLLERKAALDAKAAIRDLEAELKGARAAAQDVETRRADVARLQEALSRARERRARVEEATRRVLEAAQTRAAFEQDFARDRGVLEKIEPAGDPPVPPERDPRRETKLREIAEASAAAAAARDALRAFDAEVNDHHHAVKRFAELADEVRRLERSTMGRVLGVLEEIPDSADPGIPELRAAVHELAASYRSDLERAQARFKAEKARHDEIRSRYPDWEARLSELSEASRAARSKEDAASKALKAIEAEQATVTGDYQAQRKTWEMRDRAYRQTKEAVQRWETSIERAKAQEADARERLETIEPAPTGEVEAATSALQEGKDALERAEKAAGAVRGYEAAVERAERAKVGEEAWKICEEALKVIGEPLVGRAAAPLLDRANEVLERAGRPERLYLELENDRGKPIFEIGFLRNGVRISLEALSAGATVLLSAALSVAITLLSPGRRFLLIEADPLDERNLRTLLEALGPWAEQLDALIVATARELPRDFHVEPWHVLKLDAPLAVPRPTPTLVGGAA